MFIVSQIARILLALIFIFFGLSPLFMGPPPPLPGLAGTLTISLYQSHWTYTIAFAQLVAGVLLLVNRYAAVALIILAAFLYNSFSYHALTMPEMLPLPLVVLILWFLACWPYRVQFAALFTTKPLRAEKAAADVAYDRH